MDAVIRELLKKRIIEKVKEVQVLDEVVAGAMVQYREKYKAHEVFKIAYDTLLLAAQGMGLVKLLEDLSDLGEDDKKWLEEVAQSYEELKGNVYKEIPWVCLKCPAFLTRQNLRF